MPRFYHTFTRGAWHKGRYDHPALSAFAETYYVDTVKLVEWQDTARSPMP